MMRYFKDHNDGVYIAATPVDGWIEITKSEYDLLNPILSPTLAERKADKQSEIDALEASQYMKRGEREGWLMMFEAQAAAQSVSLETLYGVNPFYKKLKDVNDQVTVLRNAMKEIT